MSWSLIKLKHSLPFLRYLRFYEIKDTIKTVRDVGLSCTFRVLIDSLEGVVQVETHIGELEVTGITRFGSFSGTRFSSSLIVRRPMKQSVRNNKSNLHIFEITSESVEGGVSVYVRLFVIEKTIVFNSRG